MPELCEVVLISQYLTTKIKNQFITDIEIIAGKYSHKHLEGINYLQNHKNKIININTKGKFMWFNLKNEYEEYVYLLNWFGLTGEWSFKKGNSDRIVLSIESDPGSDKNIKTKLYFSDQRNFGIIQITQNVDILDKKIDTLAPDFLKTDFSVNQFQRWYKEFILKHPKKKNIPIVALLLEQDTKKGIGSGIGNYLSAEILYRAKISPYRPLDSLSDDDLKTLANTIKLVVKMCYISNKTGYMEKLIDFVDEHKKLVEEGVFPDYQPEILIDTLPQFEFLVYRKKKDSHNNVVLADEIDGTGRTTYWVKEVQK